MQIVCLVGSLRKLSFNRALFNAAKELAPGGMELIEAPIGDLPLLNIDEENPMPIASAKLKSAIDDADGVLIITPEYNRSVPGVLKNAIDWASRPDGGSSWEGKPVAVMGATNGRLGTAAAQMHLKGMLVYLNTRPLGQPEFYQGQIKALLSEDGTNIADEPTRERIAKYLKAFKVHVKNQSV